MLVAGLSCLAMQAQADNGSAGKTKIGGKMYWDFTNINSKSNGTSVDPNGLGFDVKRFYVGIDHSFNDMWSVNFTSDFNYSSSDGNTQVYVKKAFVQGHFSDAANLRLGSADMPWIPFAENMYKYRFVENTLIDRLHYGNSADWGAFFLGKNGPANYEVAVVNGGGYHNPSRSKGVDIEGRVAFAPVSGLTLAIGGYSGKRGKDTEATPAVNTTSRLDLLANYQVSRFHVGMEYFSASNWNNVTTTQTDKADGYSLFGDYTFMPNTAFFVRYDSAKLSKTLDPSLKDTYYNAGVSFQTTKGVTWAVAYKHEKLADNATINKKNDEIGVWAQVAF